MKVVHVLLKLCLRASHEGQDGRRSAMTGWAGAAIRPLPDAQAHLPPAARSHHRPVRRSPRVSPTAECACT
eukprot:48578-Eustigmatos_ZCMA.PRE.1